MSKDKIKVIPYSPGFVEQIMKMWRDSKERAIGQKEIHGFRNHMI